MVLEKKPQTVAGFDPSGEEPLFGEASGSEDPVTETSGSETQGEGGAFRLTRLTLKIFRTDDFEQVPLFTLTTWIDPGKNEGGIR